MPIHLKQALIIMTLGNEAVKNWCQQEQPMKSVPFDGYLIKHDKCTSKIRLVIIGKPQTKLLLQLAKIRMNHTLILLAPNHFLIYMPIQIVEQLIQLCLPLR